MKFRVQRDPADGKVTVQITGEEMHAFAALTPTQARTLGQHLHWEAHQSATEVEDGD